MIDFALSAEALALSTTPSGVERIATKNREHWLRLRQGDVTASNIAALFGQYEYFGRAGLWEIKSGIAPPPDTESWVMELGSFLEPKAIQKLAAKHPDWRISPLGNKFYFRDPVARIGATPDAFAIRPDMPGFGVIQIKTAHSYSEKKWLDAAGDMHCPTWVGMQAMTEAMLTGASWALVATLFVRDGRVLDIDVPIMADLWQTMRDATDEFWRSVDAKEMPEPDPIRDAKVIARIYANDDGTQVDLSSNNRLPILLARRDELKAIEANARDAEKERKAIDVELIAALGNSTTGISADGRVFSAKTTRRNGYVVEPTSYRTVKVSASSNAPMPSPAALPERF